VLAELSPRSLCRQRYELESWVSFERLSKKKPSSPKAVTGLSTIEEERAQVAKIISLVNRKSNEI